MIEIKCTDEQRDELIHVILRTDFCPIERENECIDNCAACLENKIKWIITADYRDWETDRKSTRLNSSHSAKSRMPSSA